MGLTSILLLSLLTFSQSPFDHLTRDASVPHIKEVLGHDFGEKITMHAEVLRYAHALAEASPRVLLTERGKTWEGRAMGLLMIGKPEHIARLEALRNRWQAISDPRSCDEKAFEAQARDLPALVWLSESVHGNEISGVDSGLYLAWHLASAQNDAETDAILDKAVLAIELMQNPDGRDHFIHHARRHRSPLGGDPSRFAAERDEGWPSGRYNHYNFDMNRDWFAMTQPETQTKVAAFLKWLPQVVVDLHEMGGDASFFAANPSEPANPILSGEMREDYRELGKAIGDLFDRHGIDYFHGETFDSFYPGYGESWPSLQGSIGVLFEQGSARGLVYQRRNGDLLTHRQAVTQQLLASWAVLRYAAENREKVLRAFYQRRAEALNAVGPRTVYLLPGDDPARTVYLARLLRDQGIEVSRLLEPLKAVTGSAAFDRDSRKHEIPAGSFVVSLNQPAGRLARTLLAAHIPMDDKFLDGERQRWDRHREDARIYDVTAWSLPLIHGVEAVYSTERVKDGTEEDFRIRHEMTNPDANLGFLIPRGSQVYPMLATMLREGFRISYTMRAIHHKDHVFEPGSLVLRHAQNGTDLAKRLKALADRFEVSLVGIDSSWFEEGPSLGSGDVIDLKTPRIALLWGEGTGAMSAGWMRFIIEQRFGYPLTAIYPSTLKRAKLSEFDVILMPEGYRWSDDLGKGGAKMLDSWVGQGGVLIAVGASLEWLLDDDVDLLPSAREWAGGTVGSDKEDKDPPKKPEKDPQEMILPRQEKPQRAYGALLRAKVDPEHWLGFGIGKEAAVMVNSSRVLRPLRLDDGANPLRFTDKDTLLLSGHIPEETLTQFAHKPFAMTVRKGGGLVVAFSEDLNFRAFMRGLEPLLGNAIFLGPSQTD